MRALVIDDSRAVRMILSRVLRLKLGDTALRDLVARRTPLFEFAIRTALAESDLESAEGRVSSLRRCVPMVAQIKDPTLRDEYARQLAGWVGWDDVAQVIHRVREQAKDPRARTDNKRGAPARKAAAPAVATRPDPRDPMLNRQRLALKAALQYPALTGPVFDTVGVESYTHPAYVAVRNAISAAGGIGAGLTGTPWSTAVREQCATPQVLNLVNELSVEEFGATDEEMLVRTIAGVLTNLQEVWVGRQVAEIKSKLQRVSPIDDTEEYNNLFGDLIALETYRKSLQQQANGDDLTA